MMNPTAEPERDIEAETLIAGSLLFDSQWYLAINPDVAENGYSPVTHYLNFGGLEGRPASPAFHSASYLIWNDDVARAGMNPLLHYLVAGEAEGRGFKSVEAFSADLGEGNSVELSSLGVRVARSALFNRDWFVETYPHVALSGLHPVLYFMRFGQAEGMNPGPEFDVEAYLVDNPDVAAENLNPFAHYLLNGQAEGRMIRPLPDGWRPKSRPGPAAETDRVENAALPQQDAFMEAAAPAEIIIIGAEASDAGVDTDDLAGIGVETAALAKLAASPLFDKAWYMMQYGDVARAGVDAVFHYFHHGARELRNPSIYFDVRYYLSQTGDDEAAKENPLLHFLEKGRSAGLKPMALVNFSPPSRKVDDIVLHNPRLVPAPLDLENRSISWIRNKDLHLDSDQQGVFYGNTLLGAVDCDKAPGLDAIFAFCRMFNAEKFVSVTIGDKAMSLETSQELLNSFDVASFKGLGAVFRKGPLVLEDMWFASDLALRMRFGPIPVGLETDLVVRAFQADLADPQRLYMVGEGCVSGVDFIDLMLDSPVAPLFLTVSSVDGRLIATGLLPFPSLIRGGIHHCELVACWERPSPIEDLQIYSDALLRELFGWNESTPKNFALSGLEVDIENSIGTERIFTAAVREWLEAIFHLVPTAHPGKTIGNAYLAEVLHTKEGIRKEIQARIRLRSGGAALALSSDALPTIGALVSRRIVMPASGTMCIGSYLVADNITFRPMWSVTVPVLEDDLVSLQPADAPIAFPRLIGSSSADEAAAITAVAPIPLAIRYQRRGNPNDAVLLAPRAPDASGPILRAKLDPDVKASRAVTVVVIDKGRGISSDVLRALAGQTLVSCLDVVIMPIGGLASQPADVEDLFSGGLTTITGTGQMRGDLAVAAERSETPFLLVLDGSTILHDHRTVETLLTMMSVKRVASAACAVLNESRLRKGSVLRVESAGAFPTHLSLLSVPHLIISEPNVLDALPSTTYPVIANAFHCAMVRTDVLKAACILDEGSFAGGRFAHRFGLYAMRQGYRHLCTTGVRVTTIADPTDPDDIDPLAANFLIPSLWGKILADVTVVRELR